MRNGTQDELDQASKDARLIPVGVKFRLNQDDQRDKVIARLCGVKRGDEVWRIEDPYMDDATAIRIENSVGNNHYFVAAYELEVIK